VGLTLSVRLWRTRSEWGYVFFYHYSVLKCTRVIEEAGSSVRRFHEAYDKALEVAAALESPASDIDTLMQGMLTPICSSHRLC